MRWAGQVARRRDVGNAGFWWGWL